MDRRESIKTAVLGALASRVWLERFGDRTATDASTFESDWHQWPDMLWTGPDCWGNRLQDWRVRDGRAECALTGPNRSLHCLTHRLGPAREACELAVTVRLPNTRVPASAGGYVGFRLGAEGPFDDYRSAAVFGDGLDAGIRVDGRLFIGERVGTERLRTDRPVRLRLLAEPAGEGYRITLEALDPAGDRVLSVLDSGQLLAEVLVGNAALVSHFEGDEPGSDAPSATFDHWTMRGRKLVHDPEAGFGPVCFAQYTLHRDTLKLTAQLTPIEAISGHRVVLEIGENAGWRTSSESAVDPLGRVARFRVDDWGRREAVPYRIRVSLPLRGGEPREFVYEGTIAREPREADQLKVAVFSCNADHGFPDADVVGHVGRHRPDMALFLGDQFYESTGGFSIQRSPLDMACLDYLRKWYMFGWSYRELFRHVPVAVIPDDHDVWHGNVWGEAGKPAPTDQGWGYDAQDQGGYKMPAVWVNMVQRTQTSHLPDPYDPTPVEQGIGVYYTNWDYGGISFAILEDRKFKSAPKNVLPEEAAVVNGFITNREFDLERHHDLPAAQLLGERQIEFLDHWTADWGGAQMKVILSQTNFCAVHTLPEGSTDDQMVPGLPVPEPGEYVEGDAPALDMDTNGWPRSQRDDVLRLVRKCAAFHIAGDQHLATVVQYGVEDFTDAAFAFTGPALNNIWPRRWWPPVGERHRPLPGAPAYTGNFFDAFGNRMTVHAAANPRKTGREPSIIHDRVTGYGVVTFDKERRTIQVECWPRYVDPAEDPDGQFHRWPITISQEDNDGRTASAWLPTLRVAGLSDPVVQVVGERTEEVLYTRRVNGDAFRPKVFGPGRYTLRIGDGQRWLRTLPGLEPQTGEQGDVLHVDLRVAVLSSPALLEPKGLEAGVEPRDPDA